MYGILSFPSHDLQHSIACMLSIPSLFLRSVIVIFAPENRRSGSADIAGIDSISIAIILNAGKVFCCVGSSHHARASVTAGRTGACRYFWYSSISRAERSLFCCHCRKVFYRGAIDIADGIEIAVLWYSLSQNSCIWAFAEGIQCVGQLLSIYSHFHCGHNTNAAI